MTADARIAYPSQINLVLPPRATDDVLRERLDAAVARLERGGLASGQRLEIEQEAARLRALLDGNRPRR